MCVKLVQNISNSFSVQRSRMHISFKPFPLIREGFFRYIGVQMALPFRKDKKSGVIKSTLRKSLAMLIQQLTTCKLEITSKSRKSVSICLNDTTLQLGSGGETAE